MRSSDGINFNIHYVCPILSYTHSWEIEKASQIFYKPTLVVENNNIWLYYSMNADKTVGGHYCGRQRIII